MNLNASLQSNSKNVIVKQKCIVKLHYIFV